MLDKLRLGYESIELEPIMSLDLLQEATKVLKGYSQHNIHIAATSENLECMGNKVRLLQVFDNLLSNAAKFSPEGSTITLSCSARGAHKVVFAVEDEGKGSCFKLVLSR